MKRSFPARGARRMNTLSRASLDGNHGVTMRHRKTLDKFLN